MKLMTYNQRNRFSWKRIRVMVGMMTFLIMFSLTSCRDNDFNISEESGKGIPAGEFTLTIPLSFSESEVRTRAQHAVNNESTAINSIWVGVFSADDDDRTKSKLIGSAKFDKFNESVNAGHNSNGNMTIDCVAFNDRETRRVYIAAVANYLNVDGVLDNQEGSISYLLGQIKTWNDYINIIADVSSIESRDDKDGIFMTGLFSQATKTYNEGGTLANSHANNTVDYEGRPRNNNDRKPYLDFTANAGYDNYYGKVDLSRDDENTYPAAIHLRPLVTHIKVEVTFEDGEDGLIDEVEDFEWQAGNLPTKIYIQERTTEEDMGEFVDEEYIKKTPAASDLFTEGYYPLTGEFSENNTNSPDYPKDLMDIHDDDAITLTKEGKTKYTFGFWQYENKHWGRSTCDGYDKRELKYSDGKTYKSLCPSETDDYNNNASYFIIKAKITEKSGRVGKAEFLIHQGYACMSNGDSGTEEEARRDFSVFRNTEYTYKITIKGLHSIVVKVTADNGSDPNPDYNPGATGTVYDYEEIDADIETSKKIFLSEGDVSWAVYEYNSEGIILSKYGELNYIPDYNQETINNIWTSEVLEGEIDENVLSYIWIDNIPLSQSKIIEKSGMHTLSFSSNYDGVMRQVYLTSNPGETSDGKTKYQSVYEVKKGKIVLTNPEIIDNDEFNYIKPTTDRGEEGALINGLGARKIGWREVEGAHYYIIEIDGVVNTVYPASAENGIFSFDIPTVDWSSDKEHKVKITACSNNEIVKQGVSEFTYWTTTRSGQSTFSTGNDYWKALLEATIAKGDNGDTTIDETINGLRIYSGGKVIRARTDCFQLQGTGDMNALNFSFKALTSGKLEIDASNTGNNGPRNLVVQTGNNPDNVQKQDAGSQGTTKVTFNYDINIDDETLIYIYPEAALRIYRIKFTPN